LKLFYNWLKCWLIDIGKKTFNYYSESIKMLCPYVVCTNVRVHMSLHVTVYGIKQNGLKKKPIDPIINLKYNLPVLCNKRIRSLHITRRHPRRLRRNRKWSIKLDQTSFLTCKTFIWVVVTGGEGWECLCDVVACLYLFGPVNK
jgi:hypothetical protein